MRGGSDDEDAIGLDSLAAQCAADAAETALLYGHFPDARDQLEDYLDRQRRENQAAAARTRRALRRRRPKKIRLVCPICKEPFVAEVGKRGRPKIYDKPGCEDKAYRLRREQRQSTAAAV